MPGPQFLTNLDVHKTNPFSLRNAGADSYVETKDDQEMAQETQDEVNVITNAIFSHRREKYAFIFFMAPIVVISIVSMLHVVHFFSVANSDFNAWMLGLAFELASLSVIVAMVLLRKLNKLALWFILLILSGLQILANVFSAFDKINNQTSRIFDFFGLSGNELYAQRVVAVLEGAILPVAVLLLFKVTSKYLSIADKKE